LLRPILPDPDPGAPPREWRADWHAEAVAEQVPPDAGSATSTHPRAQPGSYFSRSSNEFGRGISFFDAIYGFAATLLIANVDAPPAEAWTSLQALAESAVAGQALGFALSFTVICVFWRVNVRLIRRLRGLDGITTGINLVAAGLVILIAYTTQGISDPSTADLPLPTAFYAANIALVALCQTVMFELARVRGLERVPTSSRRNLLNTAGALVSPLVFVVSIPIAMTWGATAGKLTWATLLVLGPLVGILTERAIRRGGD